MAKAPKLAFYIPVYKKTPEIFRRCLDSLFDLSVKEIEVVCVFDGPNEELEAVAKKYRGVKTKVIEHAGACAARNAGFAMTTAPFVVAWDADCIAKPEMARMWLEAFDRNPDAAFVYSGYEFVNEGGKFDAEPFDAYSLQCGNYIASMFPLRRELFPKWDETLKGGQDWDFWLRVVRNGGKGVFLQGYGWLTDPAGAETVSGSAWAPGKREDTIRNVRERNGIPDREIGFFSYHYGQRAIQLARICGADIVKPTGYSIEKYKTLMSLGVVPGLFKIFPPKSKKIVYWLPFEIECLFQVGYATSKETVRQSLEAGTINFCSDILSKNKLEELGIEAEVLALPLETQDVMVDLPKEFKVLIDTDEAYEPIIKELRNDLPYIKIDYLRELGNRAPFSTYSLLISFYQFPTMDESLKGMLINGRHVISNVQAPFCGYMDLEISHPDFKRELIAKVRMARNLPFNKEAQAFYKNQVDPERFRKRLMAVQAPVLEVV